MSFVSFLALLVFSSCLAIAAQGDSQTWLSHPNTNFPTSKTVFSLGKTLLCSANDTILHKHHRGHVDVRKLYIMRHVHFVLLGL